ncbi:MAG: ankyrin repeat domain-containing protein [Planctomycetaceae bacterium]|nr:ankyrin repeat domain-containing protein [Planctomycetaceae bacterium]
MAERPGRRVPGRSTTDYLGWNNAERCSLLDFDMTGFLFLVASLLVDLTVSPSPPLLADAVERQAWSEVDALLAASADVNLAQIDGMTALHWAAWHNQPDMAVRLLQHSANANAVNRYGVSPLALACQNGNTELTELLLKSGADPNTAQNGGETALMTAARTGQPGPVRLLIDHGASVNAKERSQQTAIMWAAAAGHREVVEMLIDGEADYQTPLKSGFTPFFFAVREGQTAVVDLLLDRGIDINSVMEPERRGGRNVRPGTSALLLAVENGHFELAVHLLERGADPNDQRSGFTPLHVLTWVRRPNYGDGLDGDPPPLGSGHVTSLQMVRALTDQGADVNARLKSGSSGRGKINHRGATPFLFAADTADVPLMKLLLELGADPMIPNVDHCPPLLAAAGLGTLAPGEEAGTEEEAMAAVKLLLELGADINVVDDNGETVMHGAAYKNLPQMVRLLSSCGADITIWNRENKYGWTPLRIAEGYRPGNFKPAAATIAAIQEVMRAARVEPPDRTISP